tara:strand:+ start:86 stop:283 length:198 start_codon:yes stop_codon:yes gene_type:complete
MNKLELDRLDEIESSIKEINLMLQIMNKRFEKLKNIIDNNEKQQKEIDKELLETVMFESKEMMGK